MFVYCEMKTPHSIPQKNVKISPLPFMEKMGWSLELVRLATVTLAFGCRDKFPDAAGMPVSTQLLRKSI